MLCFQIQINDEPAVTAGAGDVSVLTAIATYVAERNEITLEVAGLSKSEEKHLDWLDRALQVGDQISLRVVESSYPDSPIKRHDADPDLIEKSRRHYYEQLKREYEGNHH